MQTLNVGAGRSDAEQKEAEEKRKVELREESRGDAEFFFYAAGVAALGTGLLPVRIPMLASIGVVDLLQFYERSLGPIVRFGVPALWVAALVGLGFAARKGHRWAFWAGIVLYGCDMLALIASFAIWSFGVHGFFLFKWYQGQSALRELAESDSSMVQSTAAS